jgi:hypothetical protein
MNQANQDQSKIATIQNNVNKQQNRINKDNQQENSYQAQINQDNAQISKEEHRIQYQKYDPFDRRRIDKEKQIISQDQSQINSDDQSMQRDQNTVQKDEGLQTKEAKRESRLERQTKEDYHDVKSEAKFVNTLENNWQKWTGSKTGIMTPAMLTKLIEDPPYPLTRAESAALAALAIQLESTISNNSIATADLRFGGNSKGEFELLAYEPGGVVKRLNPSDFDEFGSEERHLAYDRNQDGSFNLYGPKGIDPNAIRQWDNGNCFFLNGVYGVIEKYGPAAIQNMISAVPGTKNEFLVQLPGYGHNPILVKLTSAEAAMFSYNTDGGVYLAVLGMAVQHVARTEKPSDPEQASVAAMPFGRVINGGGAYFMLHLLTGQTYHQVLSANGGDHLKLLADAQAALADNQPVCIQTSGHDMTLNSISNTPPTSPPGIKCYPPDAPGPYVVIHNQWGYTGRYSPFGPGAPGPVVEMTNGYFAISASALTNYGIVGIVVPDKNQSPIVFTHPPEMAEYVARQNESSVADEPGEILPKTSATIVVKSTLKSITTSESSQAVGPSSREVILGQGSILVSHLANVMVHTRCGDIKIAPNAAAYILQVGNQVVV